MTASQSRYGGAAEVGRAHVSERPKDNSVNGRGFAASGGVLAAGGGVYSRGAKHQAVARNNYAMAAEWRNNRAAGVQRLADLYEENRAHVKNNQRFAEYNMGPRDTNKRFTAPRHPMVYVKANDYASRSAGGVELSNRLIANKNMRSEWSKHNRGWLDKERKSNTLGSAAEKKALRYHRLGGAVGALGLAGLAGVMYENERRRGTIGQTRSSMSSGPSAAEMRSRRTNGM